MSPEEALDKAVSIIGSMQSLADHLGVTKGAVGQWKLDGRRIPAEHCPAIERRVMGEVRCEDLRPDVDWKYLRTSARTRTATRRTESRRSETDQRTTERRTQDRRKDMT
ncbi:MAG TPA: helix-turn-helix domain-containing protein [Noviherbaspirillum sp.]|nr:helix-turn-helix domain-containing protein [Noviherbaspirillum sp.]